MESDNDFERLALQDGGLSTANRALRLRLALDDGFTDSLLLPQRANGVDTICAGFEYSVLCVSTHADLKLKNFIGVSAEIQIVTDGGELRSVCGIVTQAASGQSDGGLATYQLTLVDALTAMDLRTNTRIFLGKNEIEIIEVLLSEWRQGSPDIAAAFEFEFSHELQEQNFPTREFTMQLDEPDGAFIRRLLKRRGIAWFFRPGNAGSTQVPDDERERTPVHTLVMFTAQNILKKNAAGTVRYHRDDATEERDSITAWGAVRTLKPGGVTGYSWDYLDPLATGFHSTEAQSNANQGQRGNRLASRLEQYHIETPHIADNSSDHADLGSARMARFDYESKYFHGECSVRDLQVGEWIEVADHPELDTHPDDERQFIVTSMQVVACNNLPKELSQRIERLLANGLVGAGSSIVPKQGPIGESLVGFQCTFTCVRRGVRIVPSFDPKVDVPQAMRQTATVVGPKGEAVHCDRLGRIKVRFPGMRGEDHEHAHGAGASGTDADSAWIRFVSPWAGHGPGPFQQSGVNFIPRPGSEVWVDFANGDPDKPIILGGTYNNPAPPPALSRNGVLPGNRYLSGIRSGEVRGQRGNQLCFDDTHGQISAQLASDHGQSELNLGWMTEPRADGEGAPRGEGAELRSDEYIALRAAKGLLLSAWKRMEGMGGATDKVLERTEYLALMQECSELFASLGMYAAQHQALEQDTKEQDRLLKSVKQWENGSNTAGKGAGGGAAIVAVTAPDGISLATPQSIVSYAATNIDTVAQQHLQMTAGQRFALNAGKGISFFSQQDGLFAIAHHGKLLMQSQHDDTQIDSAKDIRISAKKRLTIMAEEIVFINSAGAYLQLKGDSPEIGGGGPMTIKTNGHHWNGPASKSAELPTFGEGDFARTPRLLRATDGEPVPDMELHVERDGLEPITDKSNGEGKGNEIVASGIQRIKAFFYQKRS
jgi:type VI secretion system secreted protein VgrG